jgi:riboflavin synthase
MFTGLVEEIGRLRAITATAAGAELVMEATAILPGTQVGDSIACNGCCLTVTGLPAGGFTAHAGTETLARTTVGTWRTGKSVNLERALLPTSRLGGHFVQGHVDGVGRVLSATTEGETVRWQFSLPGELAPFVVEKGSIAVDGISLTVTACETGAFEVAIIPHTQAHTTLGTLRPGDDVNLETDVLAKYVHRILGAMAPAQETISEEFLRKHGFA